MTIGDHIMIETMRSSRLLSFMKGYGWLTDITSICMNMNRQLRRDDNEMN